MDQKFKQEILGEFAIDHEFETYLNAWKVYHKTANEIDGHIKFPRNDEEYTLVRKAGAAALKAQKEYLYLVDVPKPNPKENPEKYEKWIQAGVEVLRRMGK